MVKFKFWKFGLVWISKRVLNFEEKIRKLKNVLLFFEKNYMFRSYRKRKRYVSW